MRLICDKCDKEIEDFELKRKIVDTKPCRVYKYAIKVFCHGEEQKQWFEFWDDEGDGDIYFFKDGFALRGIFNDAHEKKQRGLNRLAKQKVDDLLFFDRCFNKDELTWGKGIAEHFHDLNESIEKLRKQLLWRRESREAVNSEIVQELSVENDTLGGVITDFQDENKSLREMIEELNKHTREQYEEIKVLREKIERQKKIHKDQIQILTLGVKLRQEELKNEKGNILDTWPDIAGLQFQIKMLEAELEVYKRPLMWTKEKPTEPGQWWFYRVSNSLNIPTVVVKTCHENFFNKSETGGLWVLFKESTSPIEECNGEWAGPIPEPAEREGEG